MSGFPVPSNHVALRFHDTISKIHVYSCTAPIQQISKQSRLHRYNPLSSCVSFCQPEIQNRQLVIKWELTRTCTTISLSEWNPSSTDTATPQTMYCAAAQLKSGIPVRSTTHLKNWQHVKGTEIVVKCCSGDTQGMLYGENVPGVYISRDGVPWAALEYPGIVFCNSKVKSYEKNVVFSEAKSTRGWRPKFLHHPLPKRI